MLTTTLPFFMALTPWLQSKLSPKSPYSVANPRANLETGDLNRTVPMPMPVPKLVANACLWDFQFFMRLNRFRFFYCRPLKKEKAKGRRRRRCRRHLDRAKKMWHKGRRTAPHKLANIAKRTLRQTERQSDNRRLATSGNIYEDWKGCQTLHPS